MKIVMDNIQINAQSAIEDQLVQSATDLGNSTKTNIESLLKQSEELSKQLSDILTQIKNETENSLGNEDDIIKVVDSLNQARSSINDIIGVREMDVASSLSFMNLQVQQMENRVRELESRTFGTQIKDEVKSIVNNVVSSARNAISETSKHLVKFFNKCRTSVENAISNIKQTSIDVSKAWSEYSKTTNEYANMIVDFKSEKTKEATQKKADFINAEIDSKINDVENKYKNANGLEKLAYKATLIELKIDKDAIHNSEVNSEKIANIKEKASQVTDTIKQKVFDAKENISLYTDTAKNEIINASRNVRDSIITKVISSLESAIDLAKNYANDKGIKVPEPDKKKEMDQKKDQEPDIEME